jgi:hypothetical protein
MKDKHFENWFLIKPQAISRFLGSVIRSWGYPVSWNPSDDSESMYLTVYMDIHEPSKTLIIRISDHSIPPKTLWVVYHYDVYGSYEREGAMSYVKLLSKLAEDLGKPFPPFLERVKSGTELYKNYRIEMQRRRKHLNGKYHFIREERLYV